MRKNGVARTFEILGENGGASNANNAGGINHSNEANESRALAEGFTYEKPPYSRLSPPGAIYCKPPAESAFITGGNPFKPYYHAVSETAAKKDKAKAIFFFGGEEKPFSAKEKEICDKRLKDLFADLKIGKNEMAIFTNDASPSKIVSRRYKYAIGDYPCELDFFLRVPRTESAQPESENPKSQTLSYRQLLMLTNARISAAMLKKMLESLAGDPLGFKNETYGGEVFGAAAFLSSKCAENFPIDAADAEYLKAFRLIRSALNDFLCYAAEACGEKLVRVTVSGAKSAREACEAATAFARRASVAESLKAGRLDPFAVIEALGAAEFASKETANVYLASADKTSAEKKVCVLYGGKPLFPNAAAQAAILSECGAQVLADLGAGNYSYSACIYLKGATNAQGATSEQNATQAQNAK
mgnify:CR=1 FL=1